MLKSSCDQVAFYYMVCINYVCYQRAYQVHMTDMFGMNCILPFFTDFY